MLICSYLVLKAVALSRWELLVLRELFGVVFTVSKSFTLFVNSSNIVSFHYHSGCGSWGKDRIFFRHWESKWRSESAKLLNDNMILGHPLWLFYLCTHQQSIRICASLCRISLLPIIVGRWSIAGSCSTSDLLMIYLLLHLQLLQLYHLLPWSFAYDIIWYNAYFSFLSF